MKEKKAGLDEVFYQRLNGRKSCDTLPASRAGTNTWNSCLQYNNMRLGDEQEHLINPGYCPNSDNLIKKKLTQQELKYKACFFTLKEMHIIM